MTITDPTERTRMHVQMTLRCLQKRGLPAVIARMPGRCARCEQPVVPGMQIAMLDGRWLHGPCAADEQDSAEQVVSE